MATSTAITILLALAYLAVACRYAYGFLCMLCMGRADRLWGSVWAVAFGLVWPVAMVLIWRETRWMKRQR